ncbi:MAG TPA: hypothetical protein VEH09_10705 [Thermodesulfobacteriota bacterium]|nr:hypothetical protein [Thermodesulfobacteriota bacterium]
MTEKRLIKSLFKAPLKVINVGIEKLVEHLKEYGVEVVQVDWKPPASTNPQILRKLKELTK